jgi:hypothetical protein
LFSKKTNLSVCEIELNESQQHNDQSLNHMLASLLARIRPQHEQLKQDLNKLRESFAATAKYMAESDLKLANCNVMLQRVDSIVKGVLSKERLAKLKQEKTKRK